MAKNGQTNKQKKPPNDYLTRASPTQSSTVEGGSHTEQFHTSYIIFRVWETNIFKGVALQVTLSSDLPRTGKKGGKKPLPLLLSALPFFYTFALLLLFFFCFFFHLSCLLSLLEVSAVDRRLGRRIRPGSIHHGKPERWGGGIVSFAVKQERVWQFDMHFVNNQLRISSDFERFISFLEVVCMFLLSCRHLHVFMFFDRAHLFPLALFSPSHTRLVLHDWYL